MTYLVYDAVILLILLFFLWQGYRKGFVLTLCGFLAIFVAFIGASLVSNTLAGPLSQTLQPMVEQHLQTIFQEHLTDVSVGDLVLNSSQDSGPTLELPLQEALNVLKDTPIYQGFAEAFQKGVDSGMVAATTNAARLIADYVAREVAQLVLFLISFVLILILWFFLSHALDLAFRLPVLSALNRWSGALLGLVKGALLVFIVCQLLKTNYVSREMLESTYLLPYFCSPALLSAYF